MSISQSAIIAAKDAEIAALTGERDRQYEYNVAQIAKQAELEAQIAALREALIEARQIVDVVARDPLIDVRAQYAMDTLTKIDAAMPDHRAALEMSGGVL